MPAHKHTTPFSLQYSDMLSYAHYKFTFPGATSTHLVTNTWSTTVWKMLK